MTRELLKCSICPRAPCFSDTSHLLTHIGSKGHLSHLHKLQVRSHGELEASRQLSQYNNWYQEHNLAELLAERMHQKEARKAGKRTAGRRPADRPREREPTFEPEPNVFSHPLGPASLRADLVQQNLREQKRAGRRVMQEEMDNVDYLPPLPIMHHDAVLVHSSPSQREPSCYCADSTVPGHLCFTNPFYPKTPESTRLKGQVWPGMDIFDAATEEQARKRNQRKDGSVLVTMQADSMRVEPIEVTYSVSGTVKRTRHMDDFEDESNLLEGESPIRRQPVKRSKDRADTRTSRKPKLRRQRRRARPNESRKDTPPMTFPTNESSSLLEQFTINPQSSPEPRQRRKDRRLQHCDQNPFHVYQDADTVAGAGRYSSNASILNATSPPTYHFVKDVNVELQPVLPWLSHDPLQFSYPGLSRRDGGDIWSPQNFSSPQLDKENLEPRPWKQDDQDKVEANDNLPHFENLDDFGSELGPLSHVYAYTQNSLVETSPHLGQAQVHYLQPIH